MTNAMRSHYREREISLEINLLKLEGSLVVPDRAKGVVYYLLMVAAVAVLVPVTVM